MDNTIIHLIGFPGTGKYTIAKEICKQENFRLVDNHLVNNLLFGLIKKDGIAPLPDRIWVNARKIWEAVLDTIIHISPQEYSFILTNFLVENESGREWFRQVEKAAQEKGAVFIPVRMHISVEENGRRIVQPDRKERMKDVNIKSPAKNAALRFLEIDHPNLFNIDVTHFSAEDAARKILDHVKSCS